MLARIAHRRDHCRGGVCRSCLRPVCQANHATGRDSNDQMTSVACRPHFETDHTLLWTNGDCTPDANFLSLCSAANTRNTLTKGSGGPGQRRQCDNQQHDHQQRLRQRTSAGTIHG